MSGLVSGWVLKYSPVEKLEHLIVLLVLADCAHDDGSSAFPSVDTIAQRARRSRRTVQYALRDLEEGGHVVREGQTKQGTAIWKVVTDLPPKYPVPGSAPDAPLPNAEPNPGGAPGAHVQPRAPKPSLNHPSEQRPISASDVSGGSGASAALLEAWPRAAEAIKASVTEFTWGVWLRHVAVAGGDERFAVLSAPGHIATWIRERHHGQILEALQAALGVDALVVDIVRAD